MNDTEDDLKPSPEAEHNAMAKAVEFRRQREELVRMIRLKVETDARAIGWGPLTDELEGGD